MKTSSEKFAKVLAWNSQAILYRCPQCPDRHFVQLEQQDVAHRCPSGPLPGKTFSCATSPGQKFLLRYPVDVRPGRPAIANYWIDKENVMIVNTFLDDEEKTWVNEFRAKRNDSRRDLHHDVCYGLQAISLEDAAIESRTVSIPQSDLSLLVIPPQGYSSLKIAALLGLYKVVQNLIENGTNGTVNDSVIDAILPRVHNASRKALNVAHEPSAEDKDQCRKVLRLAKSGYLSGHPVQHNVEPLEYLSRYRYLTEVKPNGSEFRVSVREKTADGGDYTSIWQSQWQTDYYNRWHFKATEFNKCKAYARLLRPGDFPVKASRSGGQALDKDKDEHQIDPTTYTKLAEDIRDEFKQTKKLPVWVGEKLTDEAMKHAEVQLMAYTIDHHFLTTSDLAKPELRELQKVLPLIRMSSATIMVSKKVCETCQYFASAAEKRFGIVFRLEERGEIRVEPEPKVKSEL